MSANSNATQPRRLHQSALASTIDRGNDGHCTRKAERGSPAINQAMTPSTMYVHKY